MQEKKNKINKQRKFKLQHIVKAKYLNQKKVEKIKSKHKN